MKKIFAIVLTVAMILSMGVVLASAATHPNAGVTSGAYVTGVAADFKAVGEIALEWVADAAEKIDLTDGKLEDWANFEPHQITPENMISWVGNDGKNNTNGEGAVDSQMPENWSITAYFVADKDYLYVGFYIVDNDVVSSDAGSYQTGDAFQINIDFGGKLGEIIEKDPETAAMMGNTQNVFYSFCCSGDGKPVRIFRDCSDDNRQLNAEGPYTNDILEPKDDVVGTTALTEDGWSAEFRLPWQLMYDDYALKGWLENVEDSRIYIGGVDSKPLATGMALYYQNHSHNEDGSDTGINWAAGTGNGILAANGAPAVAWDAYDNGITLVLEADPTKGIEFTSPNIEVLMENETEPPETEKPTETVTESESAADSVADSTADSADESASDSAADSAAESGTAGETAAEEEGCASVIGFSAAAVLMAAAAVVVLKKKD